MPFDPLLGQKCFSLQQHYDQLWTISVIPAETKNWTCRMKINISYLIKACKNANYIWNKFCGNWSIPWHSLMHERHKFWGFDEMRFTMFIVNWVLKKKALLVFFTLMPSPICFFQENCWGKQDYLSISVNPLSPKNNQHQFSPDISIDNQENRLGELIKWSAEWKS